MWVLHVSKQKGGRIYQDGGKGIYHGRNRPNWDESSGSFPFYSFVHVNYRLPRFPKNLVGNLTVLFFSRSFYRWKWNPRQLQKIRNMIEDITEQSPIFSYVRMEYWVTAVPLSNIANTLFEEKSWNGIFWSPPFLQI